MKDTIQTIRRSSNRFLSGTLLSRMTGMFRDISMAYAFGTQPAIATFMVAFRLAHLLRRLFGEGALQSAFVPEFEKLRQQDEKIAFTFFRDLTCVLTLFLFLAICLGCAVCGALLRWGNLQPDNQELIFFILLMLPSLLFICLYGLNTSLLQCEKCYFIPAVAPVAFNGIWIISVLLLMHSPADQAMSWLCLGVFFACIGQWMTTLPQTISIVKRSLTSNFFSTLRLYTPHLGSMMKPLALGVLGVGASQINSAVDSLFALYADAEGPAFLWYAIRIQQLPLALFGVAVAGAVLPPLSRAIKTGQVQDYHHFLGDAIYRSWVFIVPLTAGLFVLGDLGVNFLYGRGDFGYESVVETTYCLWAYGIGLAPAALVLILAPACYANSNYTIPTIASFAALFLNTLLNALFIFFFGWGAVSVAVATSLSAWMNLVLIGYSLSRSGTVLLSAKLILQTIPATTATCFALWGTYQMRLLLFQGPFFSLNLLSSPLSSQLMNLALFSLIFCFFFLLIYLPFFFFKRARTHLKT